MMLLDVYLMIIESLFTLFTTTYPNPFCLGDYTKLCTRILLALLKVKARLGIGAVILHTTLCGLTKTQSLMSGHLYVGGLVGHCSKKLI